MPAGDGTGPRGQGPMTGRAAGYCAGYSTPGYMNPTPGRGFYGAGRGFAGRGGWGSRGGRGYRNWYRATGLPGWARAAQGMPAWGGANANYQAPQQGIAPTAQQPNPQQEADMLKQQSEYLKQELEAVQERIKKLEKEAEES